MKSVSNVVGEISYLTICLILKLRDNIYMQVPKSNYMSAGDAGRHRGFLDLFIDVFPEVPNKDLVKDLRT